VKRVLPVVFVFALSATAWGQAIDNRGAKQLSNDLSRYVGKQVFDEGILKVSAAGDAYKITFDLKAIAVGLPKQDLPKFDFPPIALLVIPRGDGGWDVSSDFSTSGSIKVDDPNGQRSAQIAINGGRFTGVYDPELAAFTDGVSSIAGIAMTSRMPRQQTELTAGSSFSKFSASKSSNGGVDLGLTQAMANFVEAIKIDGRTVGGVKASDLVVDVGAKAVRTKPFLDLLAFAVAHDEVQLKAADQAELKALLLAVLPLWDRIDGTYAFKNVAFDTYAGNWGAAELSVAFGADGVAQNGKLDYAIKASSMTFPEVLPSWIAALLPTDLDLRFGGFNIDLDSMARKAIAAFDLNKNPQLPAGFRDQVNADFMANKPKFIVGHSVFKNAGTEVALEGEMTFPGYKPDANLTFDVAGYDKIIESFQVAARSDSEAARYFPFVLAAQGFAKKLPDGRLEWIINAKADGSLVVNGTMLKPADRAGVGAKQSP